MSTIADTGEIDMSVKVDLKKVDYITDWDRNPQEIVERIAGPNDDVEKAMELVEGWDRWPQPVMVMVGRTSSGKRVVLLNTEVEPYFYIPAVEYDGDIDDDEKCMGVEFGHSNPDGENMVKVYTRIPGDVPSLRDEYNHHEADILFPNRFLIDAGITGSFKIPADHATEYPTQIELEQIESCDYNQDSRICFADIEVDDSNGFPEQDVAKETVTSITVYDNYTEEYTLMMYHPDTPELEGLDANVRMFDTEEDMLTSFVEYLHNYRFDVITGWNFDDFDMRYLVNRLDFLNDLKDDFDLEASDLSILKSAYDEGYFGAKVKGMSVVDMLRAYKNSKFSESDSYKLEDVAQEELGEGKIKDDRELYEIWMNDPQKFAEYNIKDVRLTVELEEQQAIIKFFEEVADYVGGRLSECVDASKAVDIKILRAVNDKWAVPSGKQAEGMDFEGGAVFDPITGIKENVLVLDLKSLYPMCMKTLNAGVNTKDPDGDVIAPDGTRFSTENTAVVVDIIDELLEERQKYKDLREEYEPGTKQHEIYDRKQGAIKIVMNCFTGDTDVMTPEGIRNIKDMSIGDDVYSINPDTGDVEIKSVVDTVVQDNMYGEVEHISTNNTDLKITPNHRMLVGNDSDGTLEHFDELPKGVNHTIPRHSPVEGDVIDEKSILDISDGKYWIDIGIHGNSFKSMCPDSLYRELSYSQNRTKYYTESKQAVKALLELDELKDDIGSSLVKDVSVQFDDKHSTIPTEYSMDDWLELMGWVISEGSFNFIESDDKPTEGSYPGQSARVQISQKQADHRTNIVELADRMGINYSQDSNGVYIYNSNMYHILSREVGMDSYTKRIPDWVFDSGMPGEQLHKLLTALIDGDGDKTGEKSYRYTTVSDDLKEDVMQLAVMCGYKVSCDTQNETHRVYINRNKGSFKVGEAQTERHDDRVYCIEVEDNNTLMAGRNGKFQWTGNTLYGVMGWDKFRLADEDVGSAVTATGRDVIHFSEEVVEDMGYEVIYGDTDSVMVELGPDMTTQEALEVGKELEAEMNRRYDDFAKEELNADEHFFEMEFEKMYRRYFQAGSKKRYAGHISWKEGKEVDDTDIVGFEFRRSDYAKVAKTIQEELLSLIVRGGSMDDVHAILNETLDKIHDEEYDLETLGIPSSITKNFDSYDNKTSAVRGAEYANKHLDDSIRPGDKPKKYFIKRLGNNPLLESDIPAPPSDGSDNMFVCVSDPSVIPDHWTIDWDVFIDKQVKSPAERVLEGTSWSWNEVLTGDRQPKLGEYDFEDRSTEDSEAVSVEDATVQDFIDEQEDEFTEEPEDIDPEPLKEMMEELDIDEPADEVVEVDFKQPEDGQYKLEDMI